MNIFIACVLLIMQQECLLMPFKLINHWYWYFCVIILSYKMLNIFALWYCTHNFILGKAFATMKYKKNS